MNKILICNQKMYLTYDEALELKRKMDDINYDGVDLIVCPSFLNMSLFNDYTICAQNCFYEDRGAYTGEISPYELSLRNVKYCLAGHSERRNIEDDKVINKKVKAILRNSMIPVLCVGETKIERELRKTSEVIKRQLKTAFDGVMLESFESVIISYEPRSMIGGNKTISITEILDIFKYIRKVLKEIGITNYKLLYGGSINKDNIKFLINDEIDGYLIGNKSVHSEQIDEIIKCINSVN